MDEADLKRLEELNKKEKDHVNVDEAAEAEKKAEAEDRFAKKWAGVLLIGTQIPALFAMFTVVTGQIVLNTWKGQCGYALNSFLAAAIVLCYIFLLVYSWSWMGFKLKWKIPYTSREVTLFAPFTSVKYLAWVYGILGFTCFIVWIVGASLQNLAFFCIETAPSLYSYTLYLNAVFWLGFCIVALVVIQKEYGEAILAYITSQMEEANQDELEEKIFRKKFNEYDTEKNGTLNADQLSAFITDLGIYIPENDLPGLIQSLDTKGDGKLSFNKLQAWFKKVNSRANELPAEDDNKSGGSRGRGKK